MSKVTAESLTDEQCQAVAELMPSAKVSNLIDGAIGMVEPHRNHSRHEVARLWTTLACTACTLQYLGAQNHPVGCIFVGWGHGWQPCSSCGGSGLSPMGNAFNARREAERGEKMSKPFAGNKSDDDVQQLGMPSAWSLNGVPHSTRESVERALIAAGVTDADRVCDLAIGRDGDYPRVPHSWIPTSQTTVAGIVRFKRVEG